MNNTTIMEKPMQYVAKSGEEIKLTPQMVIEYLVRGKKELVTPQEIVYFLHTCRAKRLDPFVGDCYLIKYSAGESASIITSRHYYEQMAMEHPRCKGWSNGVVVTGTDGQMIQREGTIVLAGETLIGGWAKTYIEGWTEPKEWPIGLDGYIKKTRDGRPTQFWSKEKQPHMIAKIALVQLLREVYDNGTRGMYSPEEMPTMGAGNDYTMPTDPEPISPELADPPPQSEATYIDPFEPLMRELEQSYNYRGSFDDLGSFIRQTAGAYQVPVEHIIEQANQDLTRFNAGLLSWIEREQKQNGRITPSKPIAPNVNTSEHENTWYDPVKWINLRTAGYTAFIIDHADDIATLPNDARCIYKGREVSIKYALQEKWIAINPDKPYPGEQRESREQRDINAKLKKDWPEEWHQARKELDFGGHNPMGEDSARIWNDKISELIDIKAQE